MLDSYIIEELKRRERERLQRERQRPTLEIPVARPEDRKDRKDRNDRNGRSEEDGDEGRHPDREDVPGRSVPGRSVVQIDL